MRILAFSDTHTLGSAIKNIIELDKRHNPDVVVGAGDFSIFGNGLKESLRELGRIKKPIFLIHGNHETYEELSSLSAKHSHMVVIHNSVLKVDDVAFLGYGGGGFETSNKDFEDTAARLLKELGKHNKLVLVTHGPPHGTKLDIIMGSHVGNRSYRKFIDNHAPILSICGHLHENEGLTDKKGKTLLINPGPHGMIVEI